MKFVSVNFLKKGESRCCWSSWRVFSSKMFISQIALCMGWR